MTESRNRQWRILAVVLTGSFMAVLDTTIVNVALPSIARGAHASSDALEWVVSGYALAFGLALVPAGRAGIAVIGTVLFGSGPGGSSSGSSGSGVTPSLVHSAQSATAVNLCFLAAALLCVLGLPRRLAGQASGQGDDQQPDSQSQRADVPGVARRDAA